MSPNTASGRATPGGLPDAGAISRASLGWEAQGFTEALRTPDSTLIFVTPEKAEEILADQVACMGCLSQCRFSNWSQHEPEYTTGKKADPRSFCIQKTLQNIAHESDKDEAVEQQPDVQRAQRVPLRHGPVLWNGFIPTVRQLVERILTGR